ncbi:hypothetical protein TorRG33x02_178320 [Trema orientale]|uniref:Uncharacterized protein n=1 Tax=Trema orientale TaxID=63057 RepID=A0A2P5ELH5_TREOI|nr:hypothetical protein TorRG33x02_178320 [Trema orientale]
MDDLIPEDKKAKFLNSENYWDSIVESVIDFQVCSQSDVFVPLMSGLFYYSIAGMRIASGRTQILVPSRVTASSFASDYSCYCS